MVARLLHEYGIQVQVFSLVQVSSLTADALLNAQRWLSLGGEITVFLDADEENKEAHLEKIKVESVKLSLNKTAKTHFSKALATADFIVDGLLGIGINGPVSASHEEIINLVNKATNASMIHKYALDIPRPARADARESSRIGSSRNRGPSWRIGSHGIGSQATLPGLLESLKPDGSTSEYELSGRPGAGVPDG